ncbi:MAG: hypothetical protein LBH30_00520 [Prevotellaceae bacterium]|jgi:hypothetical protein|nr:hypothetical protein [Prevotellaceae bacterium]
MKTQFLKITAMLLLLAGMMISCGKENEDNNKEDNMSDKPCECEKEKIDFATELFNGEAILFKDLSEEQYSEKMHQSDNSVILYDTKTNSAVLYAHSGILFQCYICNLSDFARTWDIAQDGQKVHYDGTMYHSCNQDGYTDRVYTDMVLTTLNLE